MQYSVEEQSGSAQSVETASILVVDDTEQVRAVLQEIFEVHGYMVQTAESASTALSILTGWTPDIIICDVMMPDNDGFTLHREIHQNPDWCDIPFLFLTGIKNESEIRAVEELGCDGFLTKPFDPDDLISVIKGKLFLARRRRQMADMKLETYRRRVIHTLSHEFRTPLVSINTGTELLLERQDGLNDDQVRELLQSILRGGQRLERLVNDFMLLQQIDLGHARYAYELYHKPYPLLSIVHSAVGCFRESLTDAACNVQLKISDEDTLGMLYVKVYDTQVIDAIQRLLSNAHKFSAAGEPVELSLRTRGKVGEIIVADRGPGLSDREGLTEEVCKPLTQINRETFEQQGCGLGLSIARYFTTLNGGNLEIRAREDGEGLEAVLSFPLAPIDAGQ